MLEQGRRSHGEHRRQHGRPDQHLAKATHLLCDGSSDCCYWGLACWREPARTGNSNLADTVRDGDRAGALALLQQHADVNAPQPDGTTALHWAVRQDDREMADRLIKSRRERESRESLWRHAAVSGLRERKRAHDRKLLKAGADANAATTEGETALMTVARTGNVEAAKVLLAHGADVNSKEQWRQQTPLMWAVAESHPEMAQELIAHGADVNARQVTGIGNGRSPRSLARNGCRWAGLLRFCSPRGRGAWSARGSW